MKWQESDMLISNLDQALEIAEFAHFLWVQMQAY